MTFRRKLFKLLAGPKGGGGGGGGGLNENDVDFVIDLIDRQNEINETLSEAERERGREHGSGRGSGGRGDGGRKSEDPCAQLRTNLSQALKDGNFTLAENISRAYNRCRAKRKIVRRK